MQFTSAPPSKSCFISFMTLTLSAFENLLRFLILELQRLFLASLSLGFLPCPALLHRLYIWLWDYYCWSGPHSCCRNPIVASLQGLKPSVNLSTTLASSSISANLAIFLIVCIKLVTGVSELIVRFREVIHQIGELLRFGPLPYQRFKLKIFQPFFPI